MTDDSLANAGITPKERLTNIEQLLTRIDGKLDGKANQSDVAAMELRVRAIEVANALTFDTKDRLDRVEADAKARLDRVEEKTAGNDRKLAVYAGIGVAAVFAANLLPWLLR